MGHSCAAASARGSLDDDSPHLRPQERVDRATVADEIGQQPGKFVARKHGVHPECARGVFARMQAGSVHPLVAPFGERLKEDRRLFRAAVDDGYRPRLDDAGEVEELIALPEGLFTRPLGRALQDRHRVADVGQHFRASRRELFGREDLRSREDGLREARDLPRKN